MSQSDLSAKTISAIMDSGYCGKAEEYALEYYKKPFSELTQTEMEYIINFLKPGCLFGGDKEDLKSLPDFPDLSGVPQI